MKWRCKALVPLVFLLGWQAEAQSPDAAARELARAAAAALEKEAAVLSIRNNSSLPAPEFASLRAALVSALRAQGVRTAETAEAELRVTVSENPRNWLLVGEAHRGGARTVVMAGWPRTSARARAPLPAVFIERRLVLEQDEPILDFALTGEGGPDARLLVLEPARVAVYGRGESGWEQRAAFPVPFPAARDPRGRLAVQGNAFQAWLPGVSCRGTLEPSAFECRAGDALWPLSSGASLAGHGTLRAGGNAFEAGIFTASGTPANAPPFYSMAVAGSAAAPLWVFACLDGRAAVYDPALSPAAAPVAGWGSDIAGVEAPCGAGRQVLATRPGDAHEPDGVQAWEIGRAGAAPVSSPVEFAGPVTALWPSGAASAAAVVRDPDTGRYAAYHLAIGCGS